MVRAWTGVMVEKPMSARPLIVCSESSSELKRVSTLLVDASAPSCSINDSAIGIGARKMKSRRANSAYSLS